MKDWIIQRYNNGQNKYLIKMQVCDILIKRKADKNDNYDSMLCCEYDFLFNQKWGFAKAFFGTKEKFYSYDGIHITGERLEEWQRELRCVLTEIINNRDPLEYLEQFKDKT